MLVKDLYWNCNLPQIWQISLWITASLPIQFNGALIRYLNIFIGSILRLIQYEEARDSQLQQILRWYFLESTFHLDAVMCWNCQAPYLLLSFSSWGGSVFSLILQKVYPANTSSWCLQAMWLQLNLFASLPLTFLASVCHHLPNQILNYLLDDFLRHQY